MRPFLVFFALLTALAAIGQPVVQVITADVETTPSVSTGGEDAADDPAIWIHPGDPRQSLIVGTVKGVGLEVYDLTGKRIRSYATGNPNNVDIRYGFTLGSGLRTDLVAVSDRATQEIQIFGIQPGGALTLLSGHRLKTALTEVYGICMYRSPESGKIFVFVNGKEGLIEQWELMPYNKDEISGRKVRTLRVETQPEGMVADDELGVLYIGEEDKGIWRGAAEPDAPADLTLIAGSTQDNPAIRYDVEGLALYAPRKGRGYLVASSQGNNTYAVFDRQTPNVYLGSFSIGDGPLTDGTSETDGLDITASRTGSPFKRGLLIVQDGVHPGPNGKAMPQNFKFISWKRVQRAIAAF
ncbi:MAG: phytase [Bacteroidia bacterium]|nr:phytase [Bacteroidia bacterium]